MGKISTVHVSDTFLTDHALLIQTLGCGEISWIRGPGIVFLGKKKKEKKTVAVLRLFYFSELPLVGLHPVKSYRESDIYSN